MTTWESLRDIWIKMVRRGELTVSEAIKQLVQLKSRATTTEEREQTEGLINDLKNHFNISNQNIEETEEKTIVINRTPKELREKKENKTLEGQAKELYKLNWKLGIYAKDSLRHDAEIKALKEMYNLSRQDLAIHREQIRLLQESQDQIKNDINILSQITDLLRRIVRKLALGETNIEPEIKKAEKLKGYRV